MPTDLRFLPCPFCGCSDIRSDEHPDHRSATGKVFSMCCYECGARMANCASIEPMIEKWNRRVRSSAMLDMSNRLDALTEIVDAALVTLVREGGQQGSTAMQNISSRARKLYQESVE